jgi:hypothetical protein
VSGGSFDYLCYASDLADLVEKRRSLAQMADELDGHEWATDVALDTRKLLLDLAAFDKQVTERIKALTDVWKAIEWWRSADYSEDQAREAVAAYRSPGIPSSFVLEHLAADGRRVLRLLTAALERVEAAE